MACRPCAGKGGERFPTCDPDKKAMLEPRPESRRDFLHGVLQVRAKERGKGGAAAKGRECSESASQSSKRLHTDLGARAICICLIWGFDGRW